MRRLRVRRVTTAPGGNSTYTATRNSVDSAVQSAQDNNVSKIQALGDININARVVNVNGLIESGIKDYVLDIAASFGP